MFALQYINLVLIPAVFLTECLSLPQANYAQYRWSKRVIVTYANTDQHPEVLKLKNSIQQRQCEYDNRNLVHEHVNTKDDTIFKIVLIGYDGKDKYTGYQSDMQKIFDIIDRMPMRRAEMRDDRNCEFQ